MKRECKYGRMCGGIFDLCEDCQKDAESTRAKSPLDVSSINMSHLSNDDLRNLANKVHQEMKRRRGGVSFSISF